MSGLSGNNTFSFGRTSWWVLLLVAVVFGLFSTSRGAIEVMSQLGLVPGAKPRGAPFFFVLHSLVGAVALVSGVLQLSFRLRVRRTHIHRKVGYIYFASTWIAGVSALVITATFNVSEASKIVFWAVGVLWLVTTMAGLTAILLRKVNDHEHWMLRSVAVAFFFVTFTFWVKGMAATGLPESFAYPLALVLSCLANLAVAEALIRIPRRHQTTSPKS